MHRQENVDDKERLAGIIKGLEAVAEEHAMPVIFPVHPRSGKMLETFGIKIPGSIRLIEPIGFMDFLKAEANARLVLTDSGGVQEETCILGVPCVTLRENTERPETIDVGANVLAGNRHEDILRCVEDMMKKSNGWKNPFGDGHAGERIIDITRKALP
jgi:UDP-N-acetylglucosamine 2-epimerase (non-hydrolysing)